MKMPPFTQVAIPQLKAIFGDGTVITAYSKDWPNEPSYSHKCNQCCELFHGHKARKVCQSCAKNPCAKINQTKV